MQQCGAPLTRRRALPACCLDCAAPQHPTRPPLFPLFVPQGLGKLPRLTDLEFGSNNAELIIEEGLGCMPPSVTHLSLEHCRLARLPPAIARLTQVGGQ